MEILDSKETKSENMLTSDYSLPQSDLRANEKNTRQKCESPIHNDKKRVHTKIPHETEKITKNKAGEEKEIRSNRRRVKFKAGNFIDVIDVPSYKEFNTLDVAVMSLNSHTNNHIAKIPAKEPPKQQLNGCECQIL